ncbi:MAG TPA: hypothetical protein PLB36_07060 [Bacillota bacterium]|nr:hypothetical protein [Bacillota bacterium]HOL12617.1 hypothetical protein [Bacillota bacterium]
MIAYFVPELMIVINMVIDTYVNLHLMSGQIYLVPEHVGVGE